MHVLAITTCDQKSDADRIAKELVEQHLAACVQIIGPIESVYRWKGNVETSSEYQIHIKTREAQVAQINACLDSVHPYEIHELIAIPISNGNPAYLNWINQETELPS